MSLHINYCLQPCAERILTDSGARGEHRSFVLWFWIYFDEAVFCVELDAWSIRGLAVLQHGPAVQEFGICASAAIYVVGFFSAYILGPILTKPDTTDVL
jgi:hypothetical protein